jgi:hypothetical protein
MEADEPVTFFVMAFQTARLGSGWSSRTTVTSAQGIAEYPVHPAQVPCRNSLSGVNCGILYPYIPCIFYRRSHAR